MGVCQLFAESDMFNSSLSLQAILQMMAADAQAAANETESQAPPGAEQGRPTCFAANPAADMWALGLVAWHIFTGQPLFGNGLSDNHVVSILLGYHPLPFEADPSMWCIFQDAQVSDRSLYTSILLRAGFAAPCLLQRIGWSMWLSLHCVQAANIVRSLLVRQPDNRADIKEILAAAANLEL